jgi:hypothetical protein
MEAMAPQPVAITHPTSTIRSPSAEGMDGNNSPVTKPYKCNLCWYSFTRREHLQRHIALRTCHPLSIKSSHIDVFKILARNDIDVLAA